MTVFNATHGVKTVTPKFNIDRPTYVNEARRRTNLLLNLKI